MLEPGYLLDIYDDADGVHVGKELLEKYGGALDIAAPDDLSALKDRDFALIVMTKTGEKVRKYPMHNPDALAVSLHYFAKVGSALPKDAQTIAATNLYRAHLRYGADASEALKKQASDNVEGQYFNATDVHEDHKAFIVPQERSTKYALARVIDDGSLLEAFPIANKAEVLASVDAFKKEGATLLGRDRYTVAVKLAQRLSELGLKDSFVEKTAAFTPNPAFMTHIAVRKEHLVKESEIEAYDSLAKLAGALPGPYLGAALEELDRHTGLHHQWGSKLRNPWDSCYTIEMDGVNKEGERKLTETQLRTLIKTGKLDPMFKASSMKDFKEAPMEVFQSLPTPTRKTITDMAYA